MIIDVMNVNRMVAVNNLKPVTSPLFFDNTGTPDPNGLFSYEIFGFPGSRDRRERPAYIQLDSFYLVPHVYKILISLNRSIAELISGSTYFIYDNATKNLKKVEDGADVPGMGTGLDFLYEHWDNLVWYETGSKKRSDRVNLLNGLSKEEAFMDKQYVIPAFYRDMSGGSKVPEIDGMYKKLITSTTTIKTIGAIGFTYNITRNSIQNTINQIYQFFTGMLKLKQGFLHKSVLSKNIDYGVRTLITAPTYNADSWKDMPADFDHASVPLTQVLTNFVLFIQAFVESWFQTKIGSRTNLMVYNTESKKIERLDLDPKWNEDYTPEKIAKQIELFIHTPESRFYPVTIKFKDGRHRPFIFVADNHDLILESGEIDVDSIKGLRYWTWTDLFYIAAEDVSKDKHVLVTRYPVSGPHSEYVAGIKVRSTFKTKQMLIGNVMYPRYPVIDISMPSEKIEREFIDSLEIFSPYIGPMGADHDGDQVTDRGIYTEEANKWCEDHIHSLSNVVGVDGKSVRQCGDVADHTYHNLLRDPDE